MKHTWGMGKDVQSCCSHSTCTQMIEAPVLFQQDVYWHRAGTSEHQELRAGDIPQQRSPAYIVSWQLQRAAFSTLMLIANPGGWDSNVCHTEGGQGWQRHHLEMYNSEMKVTRAACEPCETALLAGRIETWQQPYRSALLLITDTWVGRMSCRAGLPQTLFPTPG